MVGVATSSTCTTSILVVLIRVLLKFRPCRIPSNFCKFCEIQKFHVLFFAGGRFTFYNRKRKRKKVWSVIKDGLVMVFRHKCSKRKVKWGGKPIFGSFWDYSIDYLFWRIKPTQFLSFSWDFTCYSNSLEIKSLCLMIWPTWNAWKFAIFFGIQKLI